ncbi:4'-phosphopantetheinyl transferase superfamily protein [Streptomyces werraensis]|nr:4'-phosphopantetheinyl transferase superfamily protein [Streptomyces werraensis]
MGWAAEFVPAAYGGRLTRADLLARALRPVFRRDVALGFGHGITSMFATGAVWAAGDERLRHEVAALLLGGGRATILHHELAHANAILRDEFTARPAPGGGHRLYGRKDVVINASRADAHVVYARTDAARGPRSHSVFLLDPARAAPGTMRHLPRVETSGMRGALFSGLEFEGRAVPGDTLVGGLGDGVALALRTFQVNRSVICGVVTAAADTVLHSAVRAATTGRAGPVARRWHKPLTGVFADLLACDAMATVALRALGLLPGRAHVCAAAVKYVVPDLLREDLEELAAVLGGRGYDLDSPEYGALDKLVRDLPVAGLGHAGTASCQAVIVPQLRTLAETAWFAEEEPPPELFRPGAELPALDFRTLGIAGGGDFMAASLAGSAARLAAGPRGRRPDRRARRTRRGVRRRTARPARDLPDPAPLRQPGPRRPGGVRPQRPLQPARRRRRGPRRLGGPGRHRPVPRRPGLGRAGPVPAGRPARRPRARPARRLRTAGARRTDPPLPVRPRLRPGRHRPRPVTPPAPRPARRRRPHADGTAPHPRLPDPRKGWTEVDPLTDTGTVDTDSISEPVHIGGPDGPWQRVREGMRARGNATVFTTWGEWLGTAVTDPGLRPLLGRDWQRYRRTTDPLIRYRFVTSRLVTKFTAAAALDTRATDLNLAYKIGGRPYLRGLDQVDISLTHTDDLIAVGVSRNGRIGVDAEPAGRPMSFDLLHGHMCSPAERAELERMPPEQRSAALLRLWTLKEAYTKAIGQGLRLGFTEFGFGGGGETGLLTPGGGPPPAANGPSARTGCSAATSSASPATTPAWTPPATPPPAACSTRAS